MGASVSIIIPLHNAEPYIAHCLDSIMHEITPADEIIVIDDGSTDNSPTIVKDKQKKSTNFLLLTKRNGGVSSARNIGLDAVTKDYTIFVDADDALSPNWRSTIETAITASNNADIIFISKNCIKGFDSNLEATIESIVGVSDLRHLTSGAPVWSKIYKSSLLKSSEVKFDENIIHGEDALFNIQVLLHAQYWSYSNDSFYLYRKNESSATHNFSRKFMASNVRYINQLSSALHKSGKVDSKKITMYHDYSFINSLFIYAKKLAAIDTLDSLRQTAKHFYTDQEYRHLLKTCHLTGHESMMARITYWAIRARLLAPLSLAFRLIIAIQHNNEEWMEI